MKKKWLKDQPPIPRTPEMNVHTDTNEYPPGDSVDEHAQLEAANELIGLKEIGQQHNNL